MLDDDSDDEDGQFDDDEMDEDLDLDPEGAQRQGTRQKVDPRREVTYQVSGTYSRLQEPTASVEMNIVIHLLFGDLICKGISLHIFTRLYFGDFYAPGLKGPPGASSNWIIRLSVCLSICP